ncbi:DNA cytosine methyltransferase [Flavobacterium sp.]|uniref:DNA cytosine methyltransferase n=1 Tax=Flavobacterium sp. TaxID=239 RepID=UPI002B4B8A6D|nr:DNA cytosine methyltransferase [Flavobacterium sp.]HLP63438.1 DNA cytosine methyltransferase [Flavobacterium sp.]
MDKSLNISAIDLFCGIGGLSFGLKKAGIKIKAGIDQDKTCEYAYSKNNKADFISDDITNIKGSQLLEKYWSKDQIKILVGCAPCQPFSTHSNKIKGKEETVKWNLLDQFLRLIKETDPQIVSMENVPNLSNKNIFHNFKSTLEELGYSVSYQNVYCPDYGIPQKRRRLVLLASKFGEISLIAKTKTPKKYKTTKSAIGHLEVLKEGERSKSDALHFTLQLSDINLQRIKASKPNGTWHDWDESLRLDCHKKSTGDSYTAVYGRMSWHEPSPTITTQFYNFGTGRFGHPEQNRALTIREAALLQTFPKNYKFYKNEQDIALTKIGVHIGNAVPVDLGYVIGKSILKHLKKIGYE